MIAILTACVAPTAAERFLRERLAACGIGCDGAEPWDLRVHDQRFYRRLLVGGSLALGRSYVDGWWDCEALDEFFARLLRGRADATALDAGAWWLALRARVANRQRRSRARDVAHHHYDRDDRLYRAMLGDDRVYSCGYWRAARTLEDAQRDKIDLVCRKLRLRPGQRVLDVGCGWGAAALHAAERYGVEVVATTVSTAQAEVARERCRGRAVTILDQDWREVRGRFDRIFSIGMFEHVGPRNYRAFMATMRRLLSDDGLFLLHTIGSDRSATTLDPWLDRYVFPNAVIPSAAGITAAADGVFVLEDWHGFGVDYERTLLAWHERLAAAWPELGDYAERDRRLWRYYLLCCAGSFRARRNQLWQILFSPRGVPAGCDEIR